VSARRPYAFDEATPHPLKPENSVQMVISLVGIGLFIAIACNDARTRLIPNELAIALGALGLVRILLAGDVSAALYTLTAAAAVFAIAVALFWRGLIGGGDAKLLAASVLLLGHRSLWGFLLVMSLCGALIALAIVAVRKLGVSPGPATPPLPRPAVQDPLQRPDRPSVPYGVAIAVGAVLILVLQSTNPG